jgi:hypothetical protein
MRVYEVGHFPENPITHLRRELRIDSSSVAMSHVKMKGRYIHFLPNSGMEAVVFWDFVNSKLSAIGLGGFVSAQLNSST